MKSFWNINELSIGRFPRPHMTLSSLLVAGSAAVAVPLVTLPASTASPAVVETCQLPAVNTPAQSAALTASYTAAHNRLSAVTDGVAFFTGGSQDQIWGTYSVNRPAQQWLQYDWTGNSTLTGASMSFWHDQPSDSAGDGVAVPRAWRLQSWTEIAAGVGYWVDVPLQNGAAYPRAKDATNTVTFAEPVVTTKLRALFDATTNGLTHAAVAVSEFAVTGEVPVKPGTATENLVSDSFTVAVDRDTGGVFHLANTADVPTCTNYVANPTRRPNFNVNDSRWVGDVSMRANGVPRVTGLSDDIRTVSRTDNGAVEVAYRGDAANANGIRGFNLTESYRLSGAAGDVLDWSIRLDNTSASAVEFEDLTIPMLMNSWWNGGDQTGIYEQNVARHSFVAKDGSYVYWQRPNGLGPYLVMVPKAGTSLEFRDKARIGEGPFAESDPAWEGLVEFAIHSKALQPARAGKIGGYLPPTSLTLASGASKTYGFTFRWANDYSDLRDVLFEAGVVDVVSLPGMVIPENQKATLAVRAKDGIESVTGQDGSGITVTSQGSRNGYSLYEVDFSQLGPNFVTVTYGGGRQSVLQYYATKPIGELVDSHAQFLVDKQQARTARGYNGAFLQWDMSRQQQISWDNYPGGGWKQWMAGGSDDLGLAPALFLAEKNLIDPDQAQIAAIDYYIENFILGYLQSRKVDGQRTWQIYRWYDGRDDTPNDQGVWRAYNYTHVANTYMAMYKLKSRYPQLTTSFTAAQYLDMAYKTLDAMFNKIPQPTPIGDAAHELGLMGEGTYPELLALLEDEGLTGQATALRDLVRAKSETMFTHKYPFASEASIDTTGFETSYTLAKMFGNDTMVERVQSSSMSSRGLQPLWYYYGGDNRHMGESWWNLGYEAHLGAWQQQDYLRTYANVASADFDETMRSTYGAYLGGWANINAGQISSAPANIGAASWQYQSQKGAGEGGNGYWGFMPMLDGWWAWSGEADLGFWGGLRTASVNVVNDPIVGLYAYGGEVALQNSTYTIRPKDGVQQRFTIYNEDKFSVEVEGATYTEATVTQARDDISLTLANPGDGSYMPSVTLDKLPAGTYYISTDGATPTTSVTHSGGDVTFDLSALTGAEHRVRISSDNQAPTLTTPQDQSLTATSGAGARAIFGAATAYDDIDGVVPATCDRESGQVYAPGVTTVTCTAVDRAGNTATSTFDVSVLFNWGGFKAPIVETDKNGNRVVNQVKAGATVPVKFGLGGDMGLAVLQGNLTSRAVPCDPSLAINRLGATPVTGGTGLQYDAASGTYTMNWKTDSSFSGCRELDVPLVDGRVHSALFQFRK